MNLFECKDVRVEVDDLQHLFHLHIQSLGEWKRIEGELPYPVNRQEFEDKLDSAVQTGTFGIMNLLDQLRRECPCTFDQLLAKISSSV